MGLVSMFYSHSRQSIGIISSLFSGYTISLPGRVFGEQRGNTAEILSRIGVEHENSTPDTHLRVGLGPILT